MINIALIGVGGWGKNLARNFASCKDAQLYACCDLNDENLESVKSDYGWIKTEHSAERLLEDKDIDAFAIATNADTHFEIAKLALERSKDVFVEKPLTLKPKEAAELVALSDKRSKILMVGHLLLYHPAVEKLKKLLETEELGDVYYLYSTRVNLGKIRKDENALWSFGPHDISVALHLLQKLPTEVSAWGMSFLQSGIEDVVFIKLKFNNKQMAHIHLSWLDPNKVRRLTIVGSKKMAVFDDMEPSEKIKVYDKGAGLPGRILSYDENLTMWEGDIYIPRIEMKEPLKIECQHFIECIKKRKRPLSDGRSAVDVVKVLDAAQKSLDSNGMAFRVE